MNRRKFCNQPTENFDPLLVPRDQLVHVDPRAGVLPNRLDDAPELPDHASDLHVVAQNPERLHHGQRLVRLGLRDSTRPASVAVVRWAWRSWSRRIVVVGPVFLLYFAPLFSGCFLGKWDFVFKFGNPRKWKKRREAERGVGLNFFFIIYLRWGWLD